MTESKSNELEKNRSLKTIFSFSLQSFGMACAFSYLTSFAFAFWETEVGLPVLFVTIAFNIYGLWDGINDPLIGYYSDKPHKYTKRWGRRFPLILIGNIPITLLLILLFTPPEVNPVENALLLFFWLTIFLCLMEFFGSLAYVNSGSLYPQKFRTDRDRRYATSLNLVVGVLILLIGMIIPPLFIEYGNKESYLVSPIIFLIIAFPFILMGIPGIREDKEMIERVLNTTEKRKEVTFLTQAKHLIKDRNFLASIAIYLPLNALATLALGSIYYFVRYVLELDASYMTIILLSFLLGQVVAIPFWSWIAGKIGFLKVIYITVIGAIIAFFPIMWINTVLFAMIVAFITSFFTMGFDCVDEPLFGYLIDDAVIKEGFHTEGIYYGVRMFILRVEIPLSATIIGVTHVLTGFDPSLPTQTALAKWGIRAHMALAPIILMCVGLVIFKLLWNLNNEVIEENKKKLDTLKL